MTEDRESEGYIHLIDIGARDFMSGMESITGGDLIEVLDLFEKTGASKFWSLQFWPSERDTVINAWKAGGVSTRLTIAIGAVNEIRDLMDEASVVSSPKWSQFPKEVCRMKKASRRMVRLLPKLYECVYRRERNGEED